MKRKLRLVQQQKQPQRRLAPEGRKPQNYGPYACLWEGQHKLQPLVLVPVHSRAGQLYSAVATTVYMRVLVMQRGELSLAKAEVSCWA
jgi:hypothetical protein